MSGKGNFSGQKCFFHMKNAPWQPWYGQENSGIRLFPVPFELTVATSDPCDRFLHVCSAYPSISSTMRRLKGKRKYSQTV